MQDPSCPGFAFRHVYRSPPYDPTTTLTFRVAGLDRRTQETTILGYAQLPAFRDKKEVADVASAKQPKDKSAAPAWLNEWFFQLPIYLGQPSARVPFTSASVKHFPPAPCATLLVRLENLSDEEEEGAGVVAKGKKVTYHIEVWTGKQEEAGTDAPVKISIYGPNGGTGPHVLDDDDPATTDEFQDGSYDKFELEVPDVGPLRHIRIGHDSEDGWFLRKVRIMRRDDAGKGSWEFPCYRWLDPDKDDLCPYRTIVPSHLDDYKVGDGQFDVQMMILQWKMTILQQQRWFFY